MNALRVKGLLCAGALAWACAASPALGQEFRVTPSVTLGSFFTDNVDFERNGKEELVFQIIPRVKVARPVGRVALSLDASVALEYSVFEDKFEIRDTGQTGLATDNRFEIVDNFFFVDVSGAITSEIVSPDIGDVRRETGNDDNRTLVQRYRISPFLVYDLGSFASVENRVTAGYLDSGSSAANETIETGASVNIGSGRLFSSYAWNLLADYIRLEESGGDTFERRTGQASLTVPIIRSLSLLGDVGYDEIDDSSVDNTPDGFFWNLGFRARPGPKLDLTAKYGQRYEDDNLFVDLRYEITARTSMSLTYDQSVETEEQILLEDLQFLGRDEDGNLIDLRTNEVIDITDGLDPDFFGLQNATVKRDVLRFRLDHRRKRDNFGLTGTWETREGLSGTRSQNQTIYGGEVSWSRRLSRSTDSLISLGYRRAELDGTPQRDDDLITFRAGLTYDITPTLASNASYVFRKQFSTDRDRDAMENVVIFTLTKTF